MLSPKDIDILKHKLEKYEGKKPYMYLDSKGLVTIGVGIYLPNIDYALKIKFRVGSGRLATKEEIEQDFNSIKKQQKGRVAEYYKRFVKLHISNEDIDNLTKHHIDNFQKELRQIFPKYSSYPNEAKMALLDLIFNLGMTNLNTQWPRLKKAVLNQDWKEAAKESNRKYPISPERNTYVRNLFEKAAKNTQNIK